jgi:hypothetical protein
MAGFFVSNSCVSEVDGNVIRKAIAFNALGIIDALIQSWDTT